MIYVDTSVVVALLSLEPSTDSVVAWFTKLKEPLISSDWLLTEFSSAISIKLRTGHISPAEARLIHREFEQLSSANIRLAPLSRTAFMEAARMVDNYSHGLRSGDSLHLAIAKELDVKKIATLDRAMAKNAQRLTMTTVLI